MWKLSRALANAPKGNHSTIQFDSMSGWVPVELSFEYWAKSKEPDRIKEEAALEAAREIARLDKLKAQAAKAEANYVEAMLKKK